MLWSICLLMATGFFLIMLALMHDGQIPLRQAEPSRLVKYLPPIFGVSRAKIAGELRPACGYYSYAEEPFVHLIWAQLSSSSERFLYLLRLTQFGGDAQADELPLAFRSCLQQLIRSCT